jgi:hypothetical protein
VNRPTVSLVDGHTRRITWPTTRVSVCRLAEADRDVVLVRGLEPNMRWRGFCEELLASPRSSRWSWSSRWGRCSPTARTPGPCR